MTTLGVDVATPFVWAAAVVVVGAITWILRTAGTAGLGGAVTKAIQPLQDRLTKHLDEEEQERRDLRHDLRNDLRQIRDEIRRLWLAIDELRRR